MIWGMSDYLSYEPRALVSSSGGSGGDGGSPIYFGTHSVAFGTNPVYWGPWDNDGSYTETDTAGYVFSSQVPGIIKNFWVNTTEPVPSGATFTIKIRRYFTSDYDSIVITVAEGTYYGQATGEIPLLGTERLNFRSVLSNHSMGGSFRFGILFFPTPPT